MAEPRPKRKIIIIPAKKESPQEQAKKRNLRVAAYCRVSTGDEEQLTSYENQKAFYTEKIMKNPDWTMVDIFADEGITGTSTCRRKQFLRMIRQCRQGKIDMILAKSVSRFARNTLDTISYTRELRSLGIAVIFEEQNINSIHPESEFLIALHAAFAQSESESISANVRWGKRQSIKDGKVTFQYKTMLGYKKGVDGNPEIIPEEAETVRRIFERYLAGKSIQNIRQALEASGVRNAAGTTEWTTSNLRSILTNEKYCGDALLQKTFIKDCISKKAILNTGQLPKVLIQDNHEAIVSREMFDAVQLEIARRRAQDGRTRKSAPTGRGKFSGKYALSGLLFCAECGTAYRRVVWTQHGETVVLLSHKKPDGHINVKVEFGEGEGKVPLDNIAKRAESYKPKERVTYKMIKEYIEAKYGFKVHNAYIAEVKRDLGLPMYDAPNAVEELKQPRKHPTAEKVEAIKDALKHFEVI